MPLFMYCIQNIANIRNKHIVGVNRMQQELSFIKDQQRERYEFLQNMDVGIILVEGDQVVMTNQEFNRLTGEEPDNEMPLMDR